MFENLLAQETAKKSLFADLGSESIPPALLFSGPPASGKLTAALETARVLSCGKQAIWNCPCPDCVRHRHLSHTDLLLFGSRTFPEEMIVAKEFILRSPGQASAYFFIRSARKLLSRFNPALWAGEETKLGKAAPLIQSIEENLATINPDTIGTALGADQVRAIETAYSDSFSLELLVPDTPAIFMIRNMELWAQLTPSGRRKVVIIENADRMQESSRNAMLKMLEEPPETVRFILLTARRASIMATILSRSRLYTFSPRDPEATSLVLSRVFKTDEKAASLQAYIESRIPFPPARARAHAEQFIGRLLADGDLISPQGSYARALADSFSTEPKNMSEILNELSEATGGFGARDKSYSGSFIRFIKALLAVLADLLKESGGNPALLARIDRWSKSAREAAIHYSSLNRSPDLLVKVLASIFGDDQ